MAQKTRVPKPTAALPWHNHSHPCLMNCEHDLKQSGFCPWELNLRFSSGWEANIYIGSQTITLPACFPFEAWAWSLGEIYTKRMKFICLIPVRECSHRMLWHGAPRATTQFGKQVTWFAWSHMETDRTGSRALTFKVPNLGRNHKTLSFLPRPCLCSFTGGGKKAISAH